MNIDKFRQLISYSPLTGKFFWNYAFPHHFEAGKRTPEQKARMFNARYAGREAFTSVNGHGYKAGTIDGKSVAAHRIAWLWVYGELPKDQIDHINGDRLDNRIKNLRQVSKQDNARNMGTSKRNQSGFVGVRYNPRRSRWEADIRVDRKLIFLGRFKCLGDALAARNAANIKYGFHENHGMRQGH